VGLVQGAFTFDSTARLPLLKGNLYIDTAEILPPVIWPEGMGDLPNLRLDIEIQADRNVRLRNPALYDMYIQGKVKVEGTLKNPITNGKINVTHGTLEYLSTPFRISEGVADFNQYDTFLPSIRLQAEAKLLDTKVYLATSGPINQMDFRLTSNPALSQQQIITLLTLRNKKSGGSSTGTTDGSGASADRSEKDQLLVLLNEGLQFTFVQRVEKVMENFLGLDEFHIVRGQNEAVTDREVYNLEVGKFVSDKVFIGYTLGIDKTDRTFRFRYDITRHLSLDGEIDDKNNKQFGLEARFTF
jgi:translocation and assembly module TamB